VKRFLKEAFKKVLSDRVFQEAIMGNLFYEDQTTRYKQITQQLKEICDAI
jgi:hypothetical protein